MKRWLCLVVVVLCVCLVPMGASADDFGMQRENMRNILNVVAKDVEKNYFDPKLKGLDWKTLTAQARQKIDNAKSVSDMVTAIYGLVDKLHDSHTVFLPPGRVARPIFGFQAKPFGDDIRVYRLKRNGAAAVAGIHMGDRILKVNRFDAEPASFDLMMLYYRVIHPVPFLEVTFQHGSEEPKTVRVDAKVRKEQFIADLTNDLTVWKLIDEFDRDEIYFKESFADGSGYIEVPSFEGEERPEPHAVESPRAVIVDLRGNYGGREDTVLEFAGHFVNERGKMADRVGRQKTEPLNVKPAKPNFGQMPVVVLVDSETSSAAEMFAKFIQVRGNGVVVGDRTAGRVVAAKYFSGQIGTDRVIPFGTQIAVGRVVFPDGDELEKKGVKPDVLCTLKEKDLADGEDSCLLLAMSIAREKVGLDKTVPKSVEEEIKSLAAGMSATLEKEYQRD